MCSQDHEEVEKHWPDPKKVSKVGSHSTQINCEQCDYVSTSERGLKQHARIKHRISQVVADDGVAEEPTTSPQIPSPISPPPPSRPSPSAPVILKKPVKMLNGDPAFVKKK